VFGVPDRDDAVDGDLDKAETKDAVKLASSKAEAGNLDGLGKDLLLKGATTFFRGEWEGERVNKGDKEEWEYVQRW
jgi:hypothetical protein